MYVPIVNGLVGSLGYADKPDLSQQLFRQTLRRAG